MEYPHDVNRHKIVECINKGFAAHNLPEGFVWARITSGGQVIIGVCGKEVGIGADGKPVALDTEFGGRIEVVEMPSDEEHNAYCVAIPTAWAKPYRGFELASR